MIVLWLFSSTAIADFVFKIERHLWQKKWIGEGESKFFICAAKPLLCALDSRLIGKDSSLFTDWNLIRRKVTESRRAVLVDENIEVKLIYVDSYF